MNAFLLAERKQARVTLWVSPAADRVVRFAARELAAYLSRMSKAVFRVRRCPSQRVGLHPLTILLSAKPTAAEFPFNATTTSPATDGFRIRTESDRIVIHGVNSRSVLYGVYELLEQMGCGFIEPGTETIPAAVSRLTAPVINREFQAAFPLRNIFRIFRHSSRKAPFLGLEPGHHLPQIDWMAKRKLNHYVFYVDHYRYDLWEKHKRNILDALLDRGFEIEVTQHSIQYFCPPDENLDYGNYGPETYRHHHPDWYLPTYAYGHNYQVRVELPEVRALIRQRFLDYLRRNPEIRVAGLWPADVSVNRPCAGLSHTDGYLEFWNDLANALDAGSPGKRISILAYFELQKPPRRIRPARNLLCWYCPIDANYLVPITHAVNRPHVERLRRWTRAMAPGNTAVFEYYGWKPPLTPLIAKMQADLQAYRATGIGGVYGWCGFSHNLMGPGYRWSAELFSLAHLMWNPEEPTDALFAVWARGVFASAAGAVTRFYRDLKEGHHAETLRGLRDNSPWISLDVLRAARKHLVAARRKADSAQVMERLNLLEALLCEGVTAKVPRGKPGPIVM